MDFLATSGFGMPWGHSLSYGNLAGANYPGLNGRGWYVAELPRLTPTSEGLGVVGKAVNNQWFDSDGDGGFKNKFARPAALLEDGDGNPVLCQQNGTRHTFFGPGPLEGRLRAVTDPAGRVTLLDWDTERLRLRQVSWTGDGQSARFAYDYMVAGVNAGLLERVTLSVNGRATDRVSFAYHDGAGAGGPPGTLASAAKEKYFDATAQWAEVDVTGFRYYLAGEAEGFEYGMKAVIGPAGMRQLRRDGVSWLTAPDSVLIGYTENWFGYDSLKRVTSERVRGGSALTLLSYLSNPEAPGYADVSTWEVCTVETRPDGNTNTVYSNKAGQTLVRKFTETATGAIFVHAWFYNELFRVINEAGPSAVASLTEPVDGVGPLGVSLNATGLLHRFQYYETDDTETGAVKGHLGWTYVQPGLDGTASLTAKWTYDTWMLNGYSVHPVRASLAYPGMDQVATTTYERDYYTDGTGGGTFQVRELTVTPPVVPPEENGTGLAEPGTQVLDTRGRLTWARNARGFITSHAYDPVTGARVRTIQDVDIATAEGVPEGWTTPAGGGLNLITDYVCDDRGRVLRTLRPWITVDPATLGAQGGSPLRVRPVDYTLYRDAAHQVWRAQGYTTGDGADASWAILGPVSLSLMNAQNTATDEIQAPAGCACGPLGADTFGTGGALPAQGQWTRWTHKVLDLWGRVLESRVYHSIPATGEGFEGVNYNATRYDYDIMGRVNRTVSPGGTITRSVSDARGLKTAEWIGTDDTGATDNDPGGSGAAGNNMKAVWLGEYDSGLPGGDGNLTQVTLPVDDDDARTTQLGYDYRNRQTESTTSDGSLSYLMTTEYDNLDRPTGDARYLNSVEPSVRTHASTTAYDGRGRVFEKKEYYVNADGSLGDALNAQTWYDPNGNAHKRVEQGRNAVTKTDFDSLDWPVVQYLVTEAASTANENTNSVALDKVIEQRESAFDGAGRLFSSIARQRFDDAEGTGPLGGPNGPQPRSRDSFSTLYADPTGRNVFTADFGTNGGAPWQRPLLHPAPSDLVLVSETRHAPDGGVAQQIDPMGTVTAEQRDAAGRTVCRVENAGGALSEQRVTEFAYSPAGGLGRLVLRNAATGDQVTEWTYGTTLSHNGVARGDLPVRKTWPAGEFETTGYNRQGEPKTFTDANGTVHAYVRDNMGRQLSDRVVGLAPGVDELVRCVGTAYDIRGRVALVTCYDGSDPATGSVVNQTAYSYNGIGCLTADRQSHAGAVTGDTPQVQYQCTGATNNIQRRTAVIYPNGRSVGYEYGSEGSLDDALNRVQSLHDNDSLRVLAEYAYLGADVATKVRLNEPGLSRLWKALPGEPFGDAGDPYTGYDRFGRVEQARWRNMAASIDLVYCQWGYNRGSLKTWRRDAVASAAAMQDQWFGYDALYQVQERQRGLLNLNASAAGGIPAAQENFAYDETGNWLNYRGQSFGSVAEEQSRVNNRNNQVTQVDGSSEGLAYDASGNMLAVPAGDGLTGPLRRMVWDAWNQLRKVKDLDDNVIAEYQYDGLGRRTVSVAGGRSRHYYYNDRWRSVEERLDGAGDPERQHVWHPADRWDLVLRDRSTGGDAAALDERLYCLKDQLDPVAVCNASGNVIERYAYSAFGVPSILAPNFTPRNASGVDWNYLFHGEFTDHETGWQNYGYRFYSPILGRWLSRDPIGEKGGVNLYSFNNNSSVIYSDYLGTTPVTSNDCCSEDECCKTWWLVPGPIVMAGPGIGGGFAFVTIAPDSIECPKHATPDENANNNTKAVNFKFFGVGWTPNIGKTLPKLKVKYVDKFTDTGTILTSDLQTNGEKFTTTRCAGIGDFAGVGRVTTAGIALLFGGRATTYTFNDIAQVNVYNWSGGWGVGGGVLVGAWARSRDESEMK